MWSRFFERWTEECKGVDQGKLNDMFLNTYMFCDSKLTCIGIQTYAKMMTIFR